MVGRGADQVLDAAAAVRELEGGLQRRQPGLQIAPLRQDDAERRQAMGAFGDGAHLLRHRDGPLGQRHRLAGLAQQQPPGGERGQDPGLEGGRRVRFEKPERLLARVNRGPEISRLPAVTPEPLQQPHPAGRVGGGMSQRVNHVAGGALGMPGPAGRLRRLLQQARALLGQPPRLLHGQGVEAVGLRVGAGGHRLPRRQQGGGSRPVRPVGQLPVQGQHGRIRRGPPGERLRDPAVQAAALPGQQLTVEHLADQVVAERVAVGGRYQQPP